MRPRNRNQSVYQIFYRLVVSLILFACIASNAIHGEAVSAMEFYIAPYGSDTDPGTREAPVRTLERARDIVREHRGIHGLGDGGIVVILREGRYRRANTFHLNDNDSGAPGAPIVYRAAKGEKVYLDGGHILEPTIFTPVTDKTILDRLLESARSKMLQADLRAAGITEYGEFGPRGWGRPGSPAPMELFVDGVPQTVARWPNDSHVYLGEVLGGGQDATNEPGVFYYNTDRAERWTRAEDPYISGLFGVTWAHDTVGIAEIDTGKGTLTTAHSHSYGFRQPGFPSNFITQYHAVNLMEEIEEPGEYYLNRETGILYFLPPYPIHDSLIQVSAMAVPFVSLEDASHVHIQGLTFENARGNGIVVSGGEGTRIIGCTLRALGQRAIILNGGENHGVTSSDIYHVGRGGIAVSGGDRHTLRPSGHFVRNCDIHRYNRWIDGYNPGITVSGVGSRLENNHIHHAMHQAITFGGNDHEFSFNEIHHVLKDISDMGSIYVGRNPTFAGNVIRHNFFHDLFLQHEGGPGVQAIFLDDDTIYVAKVFGNVFYRTGSTGVIKFHGGGGASIANNIAIDCPGLVQDGPGDVEGLERAISKMRTDRPHGHRFPAMIEAMNISEDPYRSRYPYIYETYAYGYNKGTPRWNNYETDAEDLSIFKDPENLDFRLCEDAPILNWVAEGVYDRVQGLDGDNVPFVPIPFERIGLHEDEYRSTPGPLSFKKLGVVSDGTRVLDSGGVRFWWTPSHNADRYRVRIATDSAMANIVIEAETNRTQFSTEDISAGETYYWEVEAIVDRSRSNRGSRFAGGGPWSFTTD